MRRAALLPLVLLSGCQTLLFFDGVRDVADAAALAPPNDATVVDGAAGSVDGDGDVDASTAWSDPCRPAEVGNSFVFCDRFDVTDSAKPFEKWSWTASNLGSLTLDPTASAGGPPGSAHAVTPVRGASASMGYMFSIGKPVTLHVDYDFRLTSAPTGAAISEITFGSYLVRVYVDDQGRFGFDEYDGDAGSIQRHIDLDPRVPLATAPRWFHVSFDVATGPSAIEHAWLSIDGKPLNDAALKPTGSSTDPMTFAFGAVDQMEADMHFDNVRITRTP